MADGIPPNLADVRERFVRARELARQVYCTCNTQKRLEVIAREVIEVLLEGDTTLEDYAQRTPLAERGTHCPAHSKSHELPREEAGEDFSVREELQQLIRKVVERLGYQTTSFSDGSVGLHGLGRKTCAIITVIADDFAVLLSAARAVADYRSGKLLAWQDWADGLLHKINQYPTDVLMDHTSMRELIEKLVIGEKA